MGSVVDFKANRLGVLMEPEAGNPLEAEGVLNPAVARGPDGQLYLFPRLVARNNYSRIGIARVRFKDNGDPGAVERLGVALEPEADYELRSDGGGGCEDPRITFVEPMQRYLMTYTALSTEGPRIAMAISENLYHWERLGLVIFEPHKELKFKNVPNKDGSLFPTAIADPSGQPAMALVHRPLFPGTRPEETVHKSKSRAVDLNKECIWISYSSSALKRGQPNQVCHFTSHNRLASPVGPWERLKIGGGTPPILTRHGWMIIYHGVSETEEPGAVGRKLCYSAGVMVLSEKHPSIIRYRSPKPILVPESPEERQGVVANVVFPTGIDRRDDLGMPNRFDIYYGMADDRIGVVRLDVPEVLPPSTTAHHPEGRV
ncbi:MAG TPA: hypothetical protein VIV66_10660 [Pyrinomonadaceae bacterium]